MLTFLLKRKGKNVAKELFLGAFFLSSSIKKIKKKYDKQQ